MTNQNKKNYFFLRGLVRESAHWAGFIEKFKKTFPEANVFLLDLPGSGILHKNEAPWSVKEMLPIVREQYRMHLSHLESSQENTATTNHIFALSLGAMLASEWMQKFPEDFSSATLVNTSYGNLSPFYRRMRPQNYFHVLRLLFSKNLKEKENIVLHITSNAHEKHEAIAKEWALIATERPISFPNQLRQTLAAARFSGPLAAPISNILLLTSLGDQLVHHNCTEKIYKSWLKNQNINTNISLAIHSWAGHDLSLDDADWVLDQIKTHDGAMSRANRDPSLAPKSF